MSGWQIALVIVFGPSVAFVAVLVIGGAYYDARRKRRARRAQAGDAA